MPPATTSWSPDGQSTPAARHGGHRARAHALVGAQGKRIRRRHGARWAAAASSASSRRSTTCSSWTWPTPMPAPSIGSRRMRHDVRHKDVPLFVITDAEFDLAQLDPFGLSAFGRDSAPVPGARTAVAHQGTPARRPRAQSRPVRCAFAQRAGVDPQGNHGVAQFRRDLPDPGPAGRGGAADRPLLGRARGTRRS